MQSVTAAVLVGALSIATTCVPWAKADERPTFLPRVPGTDLAADRINRRLAEVEENLARARSDCLASGGSSDWDQAAEETYSGPIFLSLVISLGFWCEGAAHPNHYLSPLTFDVATGSEVDWRRALPPALVLDKPNQFSLSEIEVSSLLVGAYLRHATSLPEDCLAEIVRSPAYFQFWLDAETGGLVLRPTSLPYSMQACADPVTLPVSALTDLGLTGKIVSALKNAGE